MYTYCNNNSIMYTDSTGKSIGLPILLLLALGLASTLFLPSCAPIGHAPSEEDNELYGTPMDPNLQLYDTYAEALDAAYEKLLTYVVEKHSDGSIVLEYAINIYYNTKEGKFQIYDPYGGSSPEFVPFKDGHSKYNEIYLISQIHNHPGASLGFSDGDKDTATKHGIIIHVINSYGQTNTNTRYFSNPIYYYSTDQYIILPPDRK